MIVGSRFRELWGKFRGASGRVGCDSVYRQLIRRLQSNYIKFYNFVFDLWIENVFFFDKSDSWRISWSFHRNEATATLLKAYHFAINVMKRK